MKTHLSSKAKREIKTVMFNASTKDDHDDYTGMAEYLARKHKISIKRIFSILDSKD